MYAPSNQVKGLGEAYDQTPSSPSDCTACFGVTQLRSMTAQALPYQSMHLHNCNDSNIDIC